MTIRLQVGRTYISVVGNKREIVAINEDKVTYMLTYAGASVPHAKHTVSKHSFRMLTEVD